MGITSKRIIAYLVILFSAWVIINSCKDNQEKKESSETVATDTVLIKTLANPANCCTCHQKQYKYWENSHHALALRTPQDSFFIKLPDTVRLSEKRWYALYKK